MGYYNNEEIGISAEIAIADTFGVPIDPQYRSRGNERIAYAMRPYIRDLFDRSFVPRPVLHTAQRQNSVDFVLENRQTLSVKTNKRELGKVAPQIIGQATAETFFDYFSGEYDIAAILYNAGLRDTYSNRVMIFKEIVFRDIDMLLYEYWRNLFECDYLISIYHILDKGGKISSHMDGIVLQQSAPPDWDKSQITFTRTLASWNESCTVKYCGVSIGEFQAHRNRNCLKFRFDMKKIINFIS